ncbi:hypothetical protein [Massilia sp. WF1]|uniref:hypothetical protein n=1 Tax=Massilia sp. WF1 TaxID=1406431 RepID=UPI000AE2CA5D|nr:hypothetical protein [Massilia sp. WF1]
MNRLPPHVLLGLGLGLALAIARARAGALVPPAAPGFAPPAVHSAAPDRQRRQSSS